MIEITYEKLKGLRDKGELQTNESYRITDYVTTIVMEGYKSANHPFDVVVMAVSKTTLRSEARVLPRKGDDYFINADLSLWRIWYDIDGKKGPAWADAVNGKGIIYRMIDDRNNLCDYDFKNALIYDAKIGEDNPDSSTSDGYYYTFSNVSNGELRDLSVSADVNEACGNVIVDNFTIHCIMVGYIFTHNVVKRCKNVVGLNECGCNSVLASNDVFLREYCSMNFIYNCKNLKLTGENYSNTLIGLTNSLLAYYACENEFCQCNEAVGDTSIRMAEWDSENSSYNRMTKLGAGTIEMKGICNNNIVDYNSGNITFEGNCNNVQIGANCNNITIAPDCSDIKVGNGITDRTISYSHVSLSGDEEYITYRDSTQTMPATPAVRHSTICRANFLNNDGPAYEVTIELPFSDIENGFPEERLGVPKDTCIEILDATISFYANGAHLFQRPEIISKGGPDGSYWLYPTIDKAALETKLGKPLQPTDNVTIHLVFGTFNSLPGVEEMPPITGIR